MEEAWIRNMPENFGSMEWKDVTNLHPLAAILLVVLSIALIVSPRHWAILPMFILACFVSSVQKIVVVTLDFNLLRVMILCGIARIWLRGEHKDFQWKAIDKALVFWSISATIICTLQAKSMGAFINRIGYSFEGLGMYFLFRIFLKNWKDLETVIVGCALVGIPVAAAFAIEFATARNAFAIFGGVPEVTMVRQGELRCQGAFAHPIIAGSFWAPLLPLFIAMWWKPGQFGKLWAIVGVLCCLFIIATCNSSTPAFGVVATIMGGLAFRFRHSMKLIRRGVVAILCVLHVIMKGPVWSLIAKASSFGGGTGYHRFLLVDQAIRRFPEWCILGTTSTAHWGWGLQDVTNHYVLEGVHGGALTLIFFIAVIVLGFRGVGQLWRMQTSKYHLVLSWALGISLFVHCLDFIGVSYFGHIYLVWYLSLAMIGSFTPARAYARKTVLVRQAKAGPGRIEALQVP